MVTILDNRRAALDGRIVVMQERIDACTAAYQAELAGLKAAQDALIAERRELDDYEPAVDPDES